MPEIKRPNSKPALFQPLKKTARSSTLLAEEIRKAIIQGKIKPGEALPSERDMAQRFQVTRNTVREALRLLEQLRLVSIRQGSRITVKDYLHSAGVEFVSDLLLNSGQSPERLMEGIGDAWSVIGKAMMGYAVEKSGPAAVDELRPAVREVVKEAGKTGPDMRRLQGLDFEIQNRLMRSTGNQAMILLHNSIRHVYSHVAALFEPIVGDPGFLADNYKRLLAAMVAGDQEGARAAFDAYFDRGRDALAGMGK